MYIYLYVITLEYQSKKPFKPNRLINMINFLKYP
jgi:hypothetical protein